MRRGAKPPTPSEFTKDKRLNDPQFNRMAKARREKAKQAAKARKANRRKK